MRITKIELINFKRFTHLTISDIPDTSKLVFLIGSNGSGKSSLFDAFDWMQKKLEGSLPLTEEKNNYYRKDTKIEASAIVEFTNGKLAINNDNATITGRDLRGKFIGRSSIRIVAKISNTADPGKILKDQDRPDTYIDNDTRFINDVFLYIQQINNALREPVFSGKQADTLKIFRDFIEPLNVSLLKIFGGDETTTIQIAESHEPTNQTAAKLIFKKGASKISYELLSHGEKQVVILLINFIVRQEYYRDAIIFIDEMDNHLNTSLQSTLIEEIVTKWIPNDAQLWTASHALGFIDFARNSEIASILDFNLLNFDNKQEISPQPKGKLDVYEIAIPNGLRMKL